MSDAVTPITAETARKPDVTDAGNMRDLKVGDEIYTLYVDYKVCQQVTRLTGVNPLLRSIIPVLDQEDGLALCLWCMIAKPGPKADVPKDHRNLKLKTVHEWLEDLHFASDCIVMVGEMFALSTRRRSVMDDVDELDNEGEKKEEGEDSSPPE